MIKGIFADIVVTTYLIITLIVRFLVEPQLVENPVLSLALGGVLLLFLWALIKTKIVQPDYFGWLKRNQK